MRGRRGVALVMVLAATLLAGSLGLLALRMALIRLRIANDARWRVEGQLVIASALAATRMAHRADLDSIADGASIAVPMVRRGDGWTWYAEINRTGPLIRIVAFAQYRASDGSVYAARRASLMLARDPADTVRVLAQRARF